VSCEWPPSTTSKRGTRAAAQAGLAQRYALLTPELQQRLDYELGVITSMGYAGYFLIVADFIRFAREQKIATTCRGSAPGSLVTYTLGITPVDPIAYQLPFERFLNPDRVTMPDIDVDFEDGRRDEVIAYVTRKYGADRVAQIITFGTIKGKQAIRDVGRVLGLSFAETDRIVKLYPAPKQGRDFPLKDALEMEPRLAAEREKFATGCTRQRYDAQEGTKLFDVIEPFAGLAILLETQPGFPRPLAYDLRQLRGTWSCG